MALAHTQKNSGWSPTERARWWKGDNRESTLRHLVALKVPIPDIALRLNVSVGSILGKVNRMGIAPGQRCRSDARFIRPTSLVKRIPHAPPDHVFAEITERQEKEAARRTGVPFAKLQDHHCRFVIGEPVHNHYCGFTATHGPYCEHHARRCHSDRDLESRERQANSMAFHPSLARWRTMGGIPVDARTFEPIVPIDVGEAIAA